MKKKTLLMTMLMLIGFSMAKAETVWLGEEGNTATTEKLPTSTAAAYSYSQQVYWATELVAAKNLTSISYYNTGEAATRNIDLYLANPSSSYYTTNNYNNNYYSFIIIFFFVVN